VPRGWRLAWYEPWRRVGVYSIPPLHWLLRVHREIVYRIGLAFGAPVIECADLFEMQQEHRKVQEMADEYALGYMEGWKECFEMCLQVVEGEISTNQMWELGSETLPKGGADEAPN